MKKFFNKLCCLAVTGSVNEIGNDAYGSSTQMTNAQRRENLLVAENAKNTDTDNQCPGRYVVNSERQIVAREVVLARQDQNDIYEIDRLQNDRDQFTTVVDKTLLDSLTVELAESERVNEILLKKLYEKEEKMLASEKLYSCWQKSLRDEMEDYELDLFFEPFEEEWYSNNQFEYQYGARIADEDPLIRELRVVVDYDSRRTIYENMSFEELVRFVYGDPIEVDTDPDEEEFDISDVIDDGDDVEVDTGSDNDVSEDSDDEEFEVRDVMDDGDDGEEFEVDDDEDDDVNGEMGSIGIEFALIGNDKAAMIIFVVNLSLHSSSNHVKRREK
ncbi:uncharacterized protein [Clytia hemisphaerica]